MQFKVFCNVEFLALAGRRLQNKNEVQLKTNQKCKLVFGSVWVNCLPSTASASFSQLQPMLLDLSENEKQKIEFHKFLTKK